MRTSILLLTIVALFAACSDESPVGPVSTRSNGEVAAALPTGPSAKPQPSGGLTVTTVTSNLATIDGISTITAAVDATCPAGSQVVGGGFKIESNPYYAHVTYSGPVSATAWHTTVIVEGASAATFRSIATCIQ